MPLALLPLSLAGCLLRPIVPQSAAANLLHYRDFNDEVWDLATDSQSEFTRLRSNCWVGMISGSGLLMSPESGGGCGCDWPIYTSLTYRSKDDY